MGAPVTTGETSIEFGIYQSSCSCCTAITVTDFVAMPPCRTCGAPVSWRLVQAVRLSIPARPRSSRSGRVSYPPRAQLDSQSDG